MSCIGRKNEGSFISSVLQLDNIWKDFFFSYDLFSHIVCQIISGFMQCLFLFTFFFLIIYRKLYLFPLFCFVLFLSFFLALCLTFYYITFILLSFNISNFRVIQFVSFRLSFFHSFFLLLKTFFFHFNISNISSYSLFPSVFSIIYLFFSMNMY